MFEFSEAAGIDKCHLVFFFFQVNEYLKDIVAHEQRKKETQTAEPAGCPRVGITSFFTLPAFSTPPNTHKHANITSLIDRAK